MQAVILAGGRGKRLGKISKIIPKALIKIGDKSILEHQILLLKRYGIKRIWILSGYLSHKIKEYIQDGKKWGVSIHHLQEDNPLGTAGALKNLEGKVREDFLVLSGDLICDFDIKNFIGFHKRHRTSLASIIVHSNNHPFDSDLVEIDEDSKVTHFFLRKNKTQPRTLQFRNLANASIYILKPEIFKYIKGGKKSDIEKDLFPLVLKRGGQLYAYKTAEYIKDVGTITRLKIISKDFLSKKVAKFNRRYRRKAIFMDRDGVINYEVDKLTSATDFKMFPFATHAIKKINSSDYLAIIITNQPMVAKGLLKDKDLDRIHKQLEAILGLSGAKLDAIYYCPHHPERGFSGEIPQLKIKCNCRKPKIGLIKRAVKEFNIDLSHSFFIGDSTVDVKTAQNAGIRFIGVKTGYGLKDSKYKLVNDFPLTKNLLEGVKFIIKNKVMLPY